LQIEMPKLSVTINPANNRTSNARYTNVFLRIICFSFSERISIAPTGSLLNTPVFLVRVSLIVTERRLANVPRTGLEIDPPYNFELSNPSLIGLWGKNYLF
jgi:hypothetical protein